ncbi:Hypothetical protein FKW44_019134, partial [Caligus rogercresseyi]
AICSLCESRKTVAHQFRDCTDLVHTMKIIKEGLKDKIGRDLSPNEILYGFLTKDPKLRLASKSSLNSNLFWRGPGSKTTKFPQGYAEVALKESYL